MAAGLVAILTITALYTLTSAQANGSSTTTDDPVPGQLEELIQFDMEWVAEEEAALRKSLTNRTRAALDQGESELRAAVEAMLSKDLPSPTDYSYDPDCLQEVVADTTLSLTSLQGELEACHNLSYPAVRTVLAFQEYRRVEDILPKIHETLSAGLDRCVELHPPGYQRITCFMDQVTVASNTLQPLVSRLSRLARGLPLPLIVSVALCHRQAMLSLTTLDTDIRQMVYDCKQTSSE